MVSSPIISLFVWVTLQVGCLTISSFSEVSGEGSSDVLTGLSTGTAVHTTPLVGWPGTREPWLGQMSGSGAGGLLGKILVRLGSPSRAGTVPRGIVGRDRVGVTGDGALVGAVQLVRGGNRVKAMVGEVVFERWPEVRVSLVLPRMGNGVISWTNSTWLEQIVWVGVCGATVVLVLIAFFLGLPSKEWGLWTTSFLSTPELCWDSIRLSAESSLQVTSSMW